jgi:hypothetical protein
MNQVKCKTCPQIVEDTVMFCPACGGSEFERIDAVLTSTPSTPTSDEFSGKICPRCKTRNETYVLLCVCGESLDGGAVLASQAAQTSSQPRAQSQTCKAASKLWLVVGTQTLECRHGDVLGREGTLACDLFRAIPTVSGKHIAVEFRSDGWFLVNLPLQLDRSDKNITEVDGRLLKPGESAPLSGEHIVRMSSRCEVRLRVEAVFEGL